MRYGIKMVWITCKTGEMSKSKIGIKDFMVGRKPPVRRVV